MRRFRQALSEVLRAPVEEAAMNDGKVGIALSGRSPSIPNPRLLQGWRQIGSAFKDVPELK
ncbi:MAG: hypothetical protein IJM85_02000 [Clostridia bacterium]|nr:hypothetical protein [Clostridia bacterium]